MGQIAHSVRTPSGRLREARRQLLEAGEPASGLLEPWLYESWGRSRDFGLVPGERTPGAPHASSGQLSRALDHQRTLVAHAGPVMEFIYQQIRGSDSVVILADSQGMLLHSLGDARFAEKAARVALRPGAIWHEQWRGTNAIGTALAAGTEVIVHGCEHYLERNAFLTCTATPIMDSTGQLLGAFDISTDWRGFHPHTLGLVRMAARMIEHKLFQDRHRGAMQLRLHAQPEGIGTVTEGLVALSEDGFIVGANAAAMDMLGIDRVAIGATTIDGILPGQLQSLLCGGGKSGQEPCRVQHDGGRVLWARVDTGRSAFTLNHSNRPTSIARQTPVDALAALDTGDAAMHAVIGRARRVIDKPIALLLQGESGVGKELFAHACHLSGLRSKQPFVAVNCAALPDSLIEAELFGYRPGAFTGAGRDGAPGHIREANGGTLFLDEIGDMPLPMQGRLLRVLQERQVLPLGGGKPVEVDFQLICATHRRLRSEVEAGRFREDLFYRINGLAMQLPPLRERSDLGALVALILHEILPERDMRLAPEVAVAFSNYEWPGNLRQLSNALRTACALVDDEESVIEWSHLPDDLAGELTGSQKLRVVEDTESDLRVQADRCVRQAVQSSNGNMSEAARRLGISRNTLYRKLGELQPSIVRRRRAVPDL